MWLRQGVHHINARKLKALPLAFKESRAAKKGSATEPAATPAARQLAAVPPRKPGLEGPGEPTARRTAQQMAVQAAPRILDCSVLFISSLWLYCKKVEEKS